MYVFVTTVCNDEPQCSCNQPSLWVAKQNDQIGTSAQNKGHHPEVGFRLLNPATKVKLITGSLSQSAMDFQLLFKQKP